VLKTELKSRLDAMWEARWCGVILTVLATAVSAFLMWRPPVPGFSAACMGLAAAALSLRTKATGAEKATWMLIIAALLAVEVLAIRRDRAEAYAAQMSALREERAHFSEIGKGIESVVVQAQDQFKATMGRSDKLINLQSRELVSLSNNLKTLTGGQSFACLGYVPGQQFLMFLHIGRFPLYGVSARVVDLDRAARPGHQDSDLLGITIVVGDMIQKHANTLRVPANFAYLQDRFNANIFFTARNGDWVQLLRERKVGNDWVRAVRVDGRFISLPKEVTMCESIDPKFPRNADGQIEGFTPLSGPKPPACE
jgi:hypothetical protein